MADETKTIVPDPAKKPDPPLAAPVKPVEPESSAAADLAELDDKLFGPDPMRNADGRPMERGHGSRYADLPEADRAHFDALEALVKAEQDAAAAQVALDAALDRVTDAQLNVEEMQRRAEAAEAARIEKERLAKERADKVAEKAKVAA